MITVKPLMLGKPEAELDDIDKIFIDAYEEALGQNLCEESFKRVIEVAIGSTVSLEMPDSMQINTLMNVSGALREEDEDFEFWLTENPRATAEEIDEWREENQGNYEPWGYYSTSDVEECCFTLGYCVMDDIFFEKSPETGDLRSVEVAFVNAPQLSLLTGVGIESVSFLR